MRLQGEGILADRFSMQATADQVMAVLTCARDLYHTNITTTSTSPISIPAVAIEEQPGAHRSLLRLWRLRKHKKRPRRQWR
jgi:hypothetical protein